MENEKDTIKLTRDEFINCMYDTDYIFDDLDLREFSDEHFQNLLSFEENTENFLIFVGCDK